MEKAGIGTKREDCEAVLDGVGLPANSSLAPPPPRIYFLFFIILTFLLCVYFTQKKNGKIGV